MQGLKEDERSVKQLLQSLGNELRVDNDAISAFREASLILMPAHHSISFCMCTLAESSMIAALEHHAMALRFFCLVSTEGVASIAGNRGWSACISALQNMARGSQGVLCTHA